MIAKYATRYVMKLTQKLLGETLGNCFSGQKIGRCYLFNIDKCIVLHMGSRNQHYKYEMGGKELKSVEQERDSGL